MAVRKQWLKIMAPAQFGNKIIGETRASDPAQVVGRVLEVSLVELVNDLSKFYIKVKLRITDVEGDTCYTEIIGHDCMRERIYRLVQRRTTRLDAIRDIITKDGRPIRVKVVAILGRYATAKVKHAVRADIFSYIDSLSGLEFDRIMDMVFSGEMNREIKKIAGKHYPTYAVEVRRIHTLTERKAKRTVLKGA